MTFGNTGGDETFGAALRRLRQAHRLSLSGLAQRVNYSRGYLSKLENSVALPNPAVAAICDQALHGGGLLVQRAEAPGELAVKTRRGRGRPTVIPYALPAAPTIFCGRDDETTTIVTTLRDGARGPGRVPVVVVRGIAGIGKTALALTAAHRLASNYPDGCLFADLHAYGTLQPAQTTDVLDLFLRQLGVPGDEIPAGEPMRIAHYRSVLRDRRVLIVVDNARSSDQVSPFIPGAQGCGVLVTSRAAVPTLDAVATIRLGPISRGSARAMLGVADPDDSALGLIIDVCGGYPLALRVAAGLLASERHLTPGRLAARLTAAGRSAQVLDDGERSIDTALRTALACLPTAQRAILALLALHPGPLAPEAAAWLLDHDPEQVGADLAQLHGDGLLTIDARGRYCFHDLIRPHAQQLSATELSATERDQALRRLVVGYVHATHATSIIFAPHRHRPTDLVTPPDHPLTFDGAQAAHAWCLHELPNLRMLGELAARRGWDRECWQLAYCLRDYFFLAKALDAWVSSHRAAVQAARRAGDEWAQAVTHNNLGLGLLEQGDITAGQDQYRMAMRIFQRLGDRAGLAATTGHRAWAAHCLGRYIHGYGLAQQALSLYQDTRDSRGVAITLRTMGLIAARLPDAYQIDPIELLNRALTHFNDLGLILDEAMTLNCLGEVHRERRSARGAAHHFVRAIRRSRDCQSRHEEIRGVTGLAVTVAIAGHPRISQQLLIAARELAESGY